MSEEELIETLKEFEKNKVEQLKEPSKNLFYAIMKIADERDKYKIVLDKIKERHWKTRRNYVEDLTKLYDKLSEILEEIE